MSAWYVIQVVGGREDNVSRKLVKLCDPSTYERVFIPRYETKRRRGGRWVLSREVFFPGYVFVDTETPHKFRAELNKVPAMTRLLASGDEAQGRQFIPLADSEKVLISSLIGEDDFVMKMSEGIIEGDEVVILKGPLVGCAGMIERIDRHKRAAWLGIEILGRKKSVRVGLEIVRKMA